MSNGQIEVIFGRKCTFIQCSYYFNTLFCVTLQYPLSKIEILCQKEKQYTFKQHDFFRTLCQMGIYYKRFMIYPHAIALNVRYT